MPLLLVQLASLLPAHLLCSVDSNTAFQGPCSFFCSGILLGSQADSTAHCLDSQHHSHQAVMLIAVLLPSCSHGVTNKDTCAVYPVQALLGWQQH